MRSLARFTLVSLIFTFSAATAFAQGGNDWWKMPGTKPASEKNQPAEAERPKNSGVSRGQLAIENNTSAGESVKKVTLADTFIRRNSTVFVDEMGGFEHYLMAAMRKKSVPLIVVADPMQADYIIFGNADTKRAGWAKMLFMGDGRSGEMASISMVDRRTRVVVFADSSHRYSAIRGKRSTAEKLAKYLGKKIKQDEKKLGKQHT
jgi:hypothetical protein